MLESSQLNIIKKTTEEFFDRMTIKIIAIEATSLKDQYDQEDVLGIENKPIETVNLTVRMDEPQILIGQQGQTLFEIQRLLRMILNKKLQKAFYVNLDINDYKKNKIEHLKEIVKEAADNVALTKTEKGLSPMSSYERRVVHAELSLRADVTTESRGDGPNRHIVIKPQ